jgi:hypothetical protein
MLESGWARGRIEVTRSGSPLLVGYFRAFKVGKWTESLVSSDFIPSYLSPETQVALRVEMEKARSPKDVEGYIYTFEIRGPS